MRFLMKVGIPVEAGNKAVKAGKLGTTIQSIAANKFHRPWRSTAWEIHPVVKIEAPVVALVVLEVPPTWPTKPVVAWIRLCEPVSDSSCELAPVVMSLPDPATVRVAPSPIVP